MNFRIGRKSALLVNGMVMAVFGALAAQPANAQADGANMRDGRTADFLTLEQKRDIYYNNAAAFLRLDPKTLKPTPKPKNEKK